MSWKGAGIGGLAGAAAIYAILKAKNSGLSTMQDAARNYYDSQKTVGLPGIMDKVMGLEEQLNKAKDLDIKNLELLKTKDYTSPLIAGGLAGAGLGSLFGNNDDEDLDKKANTLDTATQAMVDIKKSEKEIKNRLEQAREAAGQPTTEQADKMIADVKKAKPVVNPIDKNPSKLNKDAAVRAYYNGYLFKEAAEEEEEEPKSNLMRNIMLGLGGAGLAGGGYLAYKNKDKIRDWFRKLLKPETKLKLSEPVGDVEPTVGKDNLIGPLTIGGAYPESTSGLGGTYTPPDLTARSAKRRFNKAKNKEKLFSDIADAPYLMQDRGSWKHPEKGKSFKSNPKEPIGNIANKLKAPELPKLIPEDLQVSIGQLLEYLNSEKDIINVRDDKVSKKMRK